MDLGHWEYPGEFDVASFFGFLYRIVDLDNGRMYIGKKQFRSKLTKPPLKGKTRKRKMVKESDWRTYTSSSKHVNEAIEAKGRDKFVFLIESLYETKAALHYAEVEAQVLEDVLRSRLPSGERAYYNAMIANIKFLPPVETQSETVHKIRGNTKTFSLNEAQQHCSQFTDEQRNHWREKYRINS